MERTPTVSKGANLHSFLIATEAKERTSMYTNSKPRSELALLSNSRTNIWSHVPKQLPWTHYSKTGPKATEIMVLVYSLSLIPISLTQCRMSFVKFDFLSMEFCHPSCREAGPHAMEFTKRGAISILPRGFAPRDDQAAYQE